MKATRTVVTLLAICTAALTGCSTAPKLDMNKVAQAFYSQERSTESLKITGLTTLTMTGTNMTLVLKNNLTPLSIMPDDTASTSIIASAVKDTVLTGAGIWAAKSVMTTLAQKPNTVSPVVVRPEVIQVAQ